MTKKELRPLYKQMRNEISDHQKMKLDDLLLIRFQQLELPAIQTILTFSPLEHHNEPNIELITRYLQLMVPNLRICYPLTREMDSGMEAILTNKDTEFKTNRYGILEPVSGSSIPPYQLDLMLIPLLAFDQKGYRVGFGKGYYDRFLSKCDASVVKIGFSYFDPVVEISDTDQFDVPLTYCITPQHIYEF